MPVKPRAKVIAVKPKMEDRLVRMIIQMTQKSLYSGGKLHKVWAEALSEDIIRLFKEYGYEKK